MKVKIRIFGIVFAGLLLGSTNLAHSRNECSGSVLKGVPQCYISSHASLSAWQSGNWQAGGGWASYYNSIWNPNFLVVWDNNDPSTSRHKEFDASYGRGIWNDNGRLGYGTVKLRDIKRSGQNLTMTARGKWHSSPARYGKAHVQVIIWLTAGRRKDPNQEWRRSVDITVAEWMTPEQRDYYRNGRSDYKYLGESSSYINGSKYRLYKRYPGGVNELATYLAIRNWSRNWDSGVTSQSRVDPMQFINLFQQMDRGSASTKFNDDWYISRLGWEIAGANIDTSLGFTQGSQGKFQFDCLQIPNILASASKVGVGYRTCG